jgi:orotate phosphoribosyltransferase
MQEFLELVTARHGHFRLESGHHGALWLDLDALFAQPGRVAPFVDALADQMAPHDVQVVCGPLVGGAFLAQTIARLLDAEFCFTERVMTEGERRMWRARYRLPAAFTRRVAARRVAIVDDVMSAGSALRGTHAALLDGGAKVIAAGALLVLGTTGADYFHGLGVPVEAVVRDDYVLSTPDACPLCAAGIPLEDLSVPAA